MYLANFVLSSHHMHQTFVSFHIFFRFSQLMNAKLDRSEGYISSADLFLLIPQSPLWSEMMNHIYLLYPKQDNHSYASSPIFLSRLAISIPPGLVQFCSWGCQEWYHCLVSTFRTLHDYGEFLSIMNVRVLKFVMIHWLDSCLFVCSVNNSSICIITCVYYYLCGAVMRERLLG